MNSKAAAAISLIAAHLNRKSANNASGSSNKNNKNNNKSSNSSGNTKSKSKSKINENNNKKNNEQVNSVATYKVGNSDKFNNCNNSNNNNNNNTKNINKNNKRDNQQRTTIMTTDTSIAGVASTTLQYAASGHNRAINSISSGSSNTTLQQQQQQQLIVEDIDDDDDGNVDYAHNDARICHSVGATILPQTTQFLNNNEVIQLNELTQPLVHQRIIVQADIECAATEARDVQTNVVVDVNADVDVDADADEYTSDSFGSMETLSDNVSIWIDGEKHWISGVDANTTCSDLICALLNYQRHGLHGSSNSNSNSNNKKNNRNEHNIKNNKHEEAVTSTSTAIGNNAINQSILNTKENFKGPIPTPLSPLSSHRKSMHLNDYVIVKQLRHCEEYLDGNTKVFDILPARDTLARKECELLLRHLAQLPKLPPQAPATTTATATATAGNRVYSTSLLSTDKDSGMGSPVGSSRSARFRRRKHKASTAHWLAQGNTLHPKHSQRHNPNPNERLMKIILAQDETIHRQLSLLREKERQILKIEEEKHRVRERELGKNYLLETYLNALDEADAHLNTIDDDANEIHHNEDVDVDVDEDGEGGGGNVCKDASPGLLLHKLASDLERGVEIFIDEPYQTEPDDKRQKKRLHKQESGQTNMPHLPARRRNKNTVTTVDADAILVDDDAGAGCGDDSALKIFWLEKIYALNKQLQREEEILLKLHAKIRKHQVKRAYQTKTEVLQQIDKLDIDLAEQVSDIHGIERKLLSANEQLKAKLSVLECLSREFEMLPVEEAVPKVTPACSPCAVDNDVFTESEQRIKLENYQTAQDLIKLQKLIEKPTEPNVKPDKSSAMEQKPQLVTILCSNSSSPGGDLNNRTNYKNIQPQPGDLKTFQKQMFAPTSAIADEAPTLAAAAIIPTHLKMPIPQISMSRTETLSPIKQNFLKPMQPKPCLVPSPVDIEPIMPPPSALIVPHIDIANLGTLV